jgi:hypothetical protein
MPLAKALAGFSATGDAIYLTFIVQLYRPADILIHRQQAFTDRQLILHRPSLAIQLALHL